MLIPLTRKTFERLMPIAATGAQYTYCAGKFPDFLRRLLISVVGGAVILIFVGRLLPFGAELPLVFGITVGLYWLWQPAVKASLLNLKYRRYAYSGFWRGEVLDVYVTDELVGQEERVNDRGDLVIVENRERCLNLEVGDETGFSSRLSVPIKREHQLIQVGDEAEMLVLSNREDLSRINKTSDIYIPTHNVWVSDYPYVQREAFVEVSRRLHEQELEERNRRDRRRSNASRNSERGGAIVRSSRRRVDRRRPSMDMDWE
jgi:hypothetical protein